MPSSVLNVNLISAGWSGKFVIKHKPYYFQYWFYDQTQPYQVWMDWQRGFRQGSFQHECQNANQRSGQQRVPPD